MDSKVTVFFTKLFLVLVICIGVIFFCSFIWNMIFVGDFSIRSALSFSNMVDGTFQSLRYPFLDIATNLNHTWSIGYLILPILFLLLILIGIVVSLKRYFYADTILFSGYLYLLALCLFIWSMWGRTGLLSQI